MLPGAGRIKTAALSMLNAAGTIGILHAQSELGLRPREYQTRRKAAALFRDVDRKIEEYASQRAFFVTGLVREEILSKAKNEITSFMLEYKQPYPTEALETRLRLILSDWLPERDAAGKLVNVAARTHTIARTNVSDIYNRARWNVFNVFPLKDYIVAFRYSAIMDGRTTELCRGLHGRLFTRETIGGFIPPLHFNCRSILLPVTRDNPLWEAEFLGQGELSGRPDPGFES